MKGVGVFIQVPLILFSLPPPSLHLFSHHISYTSIFLPSNSSIFYPYISCFHPLIHPTSTSYTPFFSNSFAFYPRISCLHPYIYPQFILTLPPPCPCTHPLFTLITRLYSPVHPPLTHTRHFLRLKGFQKGSIRLSLLRLVDLALGTNFYLTVFFRPSCI